MGVESYRYFPHETPAWGSPKKKRKRKAAKSEEPIRQNSVRDKKWKSAKEAKPENCDSPIEIQLLAALRNALPTGIMLWCQVVIGNYSADFVAISSRKRIVIEADGKDWHTSDEQRSYDRRRDEFMRGKGYDVIRFTGSDIYRDPSGCASRVRDLFRATKVSKPKYF